MQIMSRVYGEIIAAGDADSNEHFLVVVHAGKTLGTYDYAIFSQVYNKKTGKYGWEGTFKVSMNQPPSTEFVTTLLQEHQMKAQRS